MTELSDLARGIFQEGNVSLRPATEADLELLAQWWNDPVIAIGNRGTVIVGPPQLSREMFSNWSRNDGTGGFGYTIADAEGYCVGHAAAWQTNAVARTWSIAIVIAPDCQNQGYGRAAMEIALRLLFFELAAHKVELRVWSFNDRAIHLYTSMGFVDEGVRRDAIFLLGEYYAEVQMGILDAEYRAIRGQ